MSLKPSTRATERIVIVFARPDAFEEWLALDRLSRGLLQASSKNYLNQDLLGSSADDSVVIRAKDSWASWVFLVVGSATFPWTVVEEISQESPNISAYWFGQSFTETDKKQLKKIFKDFKNWDGFLDGDFSISALP